MTKETEPDSIGRKIINDGKAKEKQSKKELRKTNMKNFFKHSVTRTIITVIITLSVVAGAAFVYQKGVDNGREMQRTINAEIQTQAKVLSAQAPVEASKK